MLAGETSVPACNVVWPARRHGHYGTGCKSGLLFNQEDLHSLWRRGVAAPFAGVQPDAGMKPATTGQKAGWNGGASGIRTHERVIPATRFPVVLLRPTRTSLRALWGPKRHGIVPQQGGDVNDSGRLLTTDRGPQQTCSRCRLRSSQTASCLPGCRQSGLRVSGRRSRRFLRRMTRRLHRRTRRAHWR